MGVLIAEAPYLQDEIILIIDIGTNGELVLGNRRRMLSTSCATGPALEGSHIEFGMRAAPGAIERVRVDPKTLEVRFKVIGREGWQTEHPDSEGAALGICGSGIIEAAAEMRRAGVILADGGFAPDFRHERIVLDQGRPRKFVIARPEETALGRAITVSLKDIRALQLAKAALRAGADILLQSFGVESPDRVVLAGAFGSYIDKHHAFAIGMLPDCPADRVSSVGNAAGDGARFALLSREKRREAAWWRTRCEFWSWPPTPPSRRLRQSHAIRADRARRRHERGNIASISYQVLLGPGRQRLVGPDRTLVAYARVLTPSSVERDNWATTEICRAWRWIV